ncbi:MAG TPA: fumarylacetoacetate hydrolase family protein [Puia sp.]|nr:fumarylacetoacetate hydrolase family protein [Puia sp.]
MKLISFVFEQREFAGIQFNDKVFKLTTLHKFLPRTMRCMLEKWETYMSIAIPAEINLRTDPERQKLGIPLDQLEWLAPVPFPGALRDGYAFRQHVLTSRRNRGLEMTPAFDEFPIFYFGNQRTVKGPGNILCMPDHLMQLDYELEVAVVICKKGKNIRAEDADDYIGGLMIMNDFSARQLQMEEMQLSLGPAKGKDFATATGPWLVTLDELKAFESPCKKNHTGKTWRLSMSASVNGKKLSEGKLSDMDWTFAEIIERASYGVDLFPGDIIGSGTVGTGCLLELNGSWKLNSEDYREQWLRPGDEIKLTVEGLGELSNIIVKDESGFSILGNKKINSSL